MTASTVATRVLGRDTGPGIERAGRLHILEHFYRAEPTRHIAGSGIGLAVVQQLVASHGGSVTIDDAAHGAAFIVTIPRAPVVEDTPTSTPVPLAHDEHTIATRW